LGTPILLMARDQMRSQQPVPWSSLMSRSQGSEQEPAKDTERAK
jgi:hypothetical protein